MAVILARELGAAAPQVIDTSETVLALPLISSSVTLQPLNEFITHDQWVSWTDLSYLLCGEFKIHGDHTGDWTSEISFSIYRQIGEGVREHCEGVVTINSSGAQNNKSRQIQGEVNVERGLKCKS